MYLILYPFMALASVSLAGLTWLFAPLLARYVDPTTGNLPKYLYWFQTFDATCFEGRKPQYGMTGTDQEVAAAWLRRNPGYGFDYWPLGIAFDPTEWRIVRNDGKWFIALGPNGKFNVESSFGLKLGWKAWNYVDHNTGEFFGPDYSWGPEHRTSLCFTPRFP